jgi:hypothetical protein
MQAPPQQPIWHSQLLRQWRHQLSSAAMAAMVLAAVSQPASRTQHPSQGSWSSLLPLPVTAPPQLEATVSQPTVATNPQAAMRSLRLTASQQPLIVRRLMPAASQAAMTAHLQLLLPNQPAVMASPQAAPAVTQARPPCQLMLPTTLPPLAPAQLILLLLPLLVVTANHQSQVRSEATCMSGSGHATAVSVAWLKQAMHVPANTVD